MRWSSTRASAAAATAGLAVAVAVVAIAARAPLSRATPVDAHSVQAPTVALFMVLAGAGIAMLGALALVAWPGRRRKDDPPEHEPTPIEVHWIWKLLALLLALAVGAALTLAAVIGTRSVQRSPRYEIGSSGGAGASASLPSAGSSGGFAVPAWLPWTLLAILGIAVTVGAVALFVARRRGATERPAPSAPHAAVQAAIGALGAEADPRRGVIAAYSAMQRTLGEQGIVRSPPEAPREYLERALRTRRVTGQEARTLTGLFEEARYSTHPIPERARELALTALRSLQRRMGPE